MYEIWVIYISIAKLLGSKHTIVCLVWCDVLNNLKMRLCETNPQLRWRTRMLVRYGPVWRYVGARVQWGGEGFGNRFEASRAARPEAEVIFGNFWLLLRLIVGFAWRFRRYTQTSITSSSSSVVSMEGTKGRLCASLDIGHSDRSTSSCEVTTEAGCPFMFLAQIRPFSRRTIFSMMLLWLTTHRRGRCRPTLGRWGHRWGCYRPV